VTALPQVAEQLLGGVLVRDADHAIVTVPHADDVSPCMPAAPRGGPEGKDIVQGKVRQEWTCPIVAHLSKCTITAKTSTVLL
jgi:hypothetical protein